MANCAITFSEWLAPESIPAFGIVKGRTYLLSDQVAGASFDPFGPCCSFVIEYFGDDNEFPQFVLDCSDTFLNTCVAQGHIWLGHFGSTCEEAFDNGATCPYGIDLGNPFVFCCGLPAAPCVFTAQDFCEGLGGTAIEWTGELGTELCAHGACDEIPTAGPWAPCCIADPTSAGSRLGLEPGDCVAPVTEDGCTYLGGIWQHDNVPNGTDCSALNCRDETIARCCTPAGCTDILIGECVQMGGVPGPEGVLCEPNEPCELLFAPCCFGSPNNRQCEIRSEENCQCLSCDWFPFFPNDCDAVPCL